MALRVADLAVAVVGVGNANNPKWSATNVWCMSSGVVLYGQYQTGTCYCLYILGFRTSYLISFLSLSGSFEINLSLVFKFQFSNKYSESLRSFDSATSDKNTFIYYEIFFKKES